MKTSWLYFLAATLVVVVSPLQAATLTVPTSFTANTPAVAAEVNGNFTAVKTAVDDNDSRLTILEAALTSLQSTVTAQAGTITSLQSDLTAANSAITVLQAAITNKADVGHNHDASYSSLTHDHVGTYSAVSHSHAQADITNLTTDLSTHTSQISAINNSSVFDLEPYLTVSTIGSAKATLSGINLQIVNGMGTTNTINGLGNLIIGYDEVNLFTTVLRCSDGAFSDQITCEANGSAWSSSHKNGSHYLVIGSQNSYSQYGGIVAGTFNYATGRYGTAIGTLNTAGGTSSNVFGGEGNVASGDKSSIGGGLFNTASGGVSSVTGGRDNTASGVYSSISGGGQNIASGRYSTVSGGNSNLASGDDSTVSAGTGNTASGLSATVSGGKSRSAINVDDWAAGSLFEDF